MDSKAPPDTVLTLREGCSGGTLRLRLGDCGRPRSRGSWSFCQSLGSPFIRLQGSPGRAPHAGQVRANAFITFPTRVLLSYTVPTPLPPTVRERGSAYRRLPHVPVAIGLQSSGMPHDRRVSDTSSDVPSEEEAVTASCLRAGGTVHLAAKGHPRFRFHAKPALAERAEGHPAPLPRQVDSRPSLFEAESSLGSRVVVPEEARFHRFLRSWSHGRSPSTSTGGPL